MTTEKATSPGLQSTLTVTDLDGDSAFFLRQEPATDDDYILTVATGDGRIVGFTLIDTLAVLSFLADAAGVERYVPGGGE